MGLQDVFKLLCDVFTSSVEARIFLQNRLSFLVQAWLTLDALIWLVRN
jgi:hypothetical protein